MLRLALLLSLTTATAAFADVGADIVVLGEVHDNADAHLGQAEMIADLRPTAVVFEMLTAKQAAEADTDRAAIPTLWAGGGWPDYSLYAPIFDALGSARIVGAAAPRADIQAVYAAGAAALFGPEAARYGLATALPADEQAAREQMQFDAHCEAMPRDLMAGMVEIQRYRDAVFARAALDALAAYGPPVAVIVGNGHARTDWGVPAAIRRAAPGVTVTSIAFVEGDADAPFDDIRTIPPAKREDPCASLTSK